MLAYRRASIPTVGGASSGFIWCRRWTVGVVQVSWERRSSERAARAVGEEGLRVEGLCVRA